ncbi:MAG: hypothetical protein KAJ12_04840, partial [Bacteroidetes bacterium]|nr:hypothetical protein [Bacteroidota bacterium]
MPASGTASDAHLLLSVNHEPTELKAVLGSEQLGRAIWHRVVLGVQPGSNRLKFTLDSVEIGIAETAIPPSPEPELFFGSTVDAREVPPMALRDVRIWLGSTDEQPSELLYHWPLQEASGNVAADVVGGADGRVSDCQWLAAANSSWILEAVLKLNPFDGVFFDRKSSRVVVVGKEDMRSYFLQTGRQGEIVYDVLRPGADKAMKVVFDIDRDQVMSYHKGLGEVSYFDANRGTWSAIDTTQDRNQHFYEHASVVHPLTGDLFAIGGYGWYKTKNTVQRYDPRKKSWVIDRVSGQAGFTPRRGSMTSPADEPGRFYVFGGFGNTSGR